MGWGDELIASGQARLMYEKEKHKVTILDRHGRIRYNDIWINNPKIGHPKESIYKPQVLKNGPGVRPYIKDKSDTQWAWNEWECPRGEIYFSDSELSAVSKYSPTVIIEPNNKQKASPNKNWGRGRWESLVLMLVRLGVDVWQMGPTGTQVFPNVRLIKTEDFRQACAVISRAKVCVFPEGGLHHAAAALNIPAVVIFGGYISPKVTGYEGHTNLFIESGGHGLGCGMRVECRHCSDAMKSITPGIVFEETKKYLV